MEKGGGDTPDGEVGVVVGCLWVSTQRDLGWALELAEVSEE